MKNLKRALSLALASVMVLGMMVVGAGAVEFKDADSIENVDAVNTLVALGILKGKDTGDFDPEGIVNRAEMAKMICVAMNNGKDPNLTGGALFPDTKTHWAGGYIDYCANMGIISGDTAGNFNPDKTVTGTEAAKMILIALGYNAENEKFVNDAAWATNINVRASQKSLYADVAINPSEGLTRDNAAQMIWNGIQADMVKYEYKVGAENGNVVSIAIAEDRKDVTILSEKFDMATTYSYLVGISYDDKKEEYTYSFDSVGLTNKLGATITEDVTPGTLKSDKDFSHLYGQKVKTLYKLDTKKTVYGIYASDSVVLAEGSWGDVTEKADTLKYDDTTYDKNANYNALDYNTGAPSTLKNEYTFKAIDNNDDGKVDVTVILPVKVAKVTFVGKDSITAGGVAYKYEDANIYEDVAKDDYAIIVEKANTKDQVPVITMAELIEGTVGAVKSNTEIRVDGVWYDFATTTAAGSETPTAGDDVELQMVNGYIVHAKVVEGTASLSNVLYVIDTKETADSLLSEELGGKYEGTNALILTADGTKSTVKSMRVDTYTTSGEVKSDTEVKLVPAPGLYTYKVNKDNVYELKAVKAAHEAGDDGSNKAGSYFVARTANLPGSTKLGGKANAGYTKDDAKLDGKFIADDAVIYLDYTKAGSKSQKVISGKDLKNLGDFGTSCVYLTKANSGLETIQVAAIVDDGTTNAGIPGTSTNTGYGYVVSSGYAEKDADDEWVVKFTVWNGTEEVELTATDKDNTDVADPEFAKGAFVYYLNSTVSGEVTEVTSITTEYAITGWDGSKNIALDGTAKEFKDDDKTVVIYVNTADKKGIEGGEIVLATELEDESFVKNAVAKLDGTDVDVIFVDTNNKLAGAAYTIAAATATGTIAVNGVTGVANNSTDVSAKAGADVALKLTVTAASPTAETQTKITATFTCADSTTFTASKTLNPTAAGNIEMTFEMPDQNITGITLAVTDVTPAP